MKSLPVAVMVAVWTTAAAAAPPQVVCEGTECRVKLVDDAGQKLIESRRGRTPLRIVMMAPTTAGLTSLGRVPWITSLELRGPVEDLAPVAKLTALRELELVAVHGASLAPLAALRRLYRLRLGCSGTPDSDFGVLANARELAVLRIANCPSFVSAAPLGTLPKLDTLELVNTSIRSLDGLRGSRLQSLRVQGSVRDVSALSTLSRLSRLELLELPEATDFSSLEPLRGLERLELLSTGIKQLPRLAGTKLLHATFAGSAALTDVGGLASAAGLQDLDVSGTVVADLRPLAALQKLGIVFLARSRVTDLSPLATARGLKVLILGDDAPPAMRAAFAKLRSDVTLRTESEARRAAQGPR